MNETWLKDERTGCWSVQTVMPIWDYLSLVQEAHQNQGGIDGQRSTLTTRSAKRIRERMVQDIKLGAVLPPVVVGAVLKEIDFESLSPVGSSIQKVRHLVSGKNLSIIDGMQRTTAIQEAVRQDSKAGDGMMRVEFWISKDVRSLVYRMLVLNTGQTPWSINRQLAVVYSPLLSEIQERVPQIQSLDSLEKSRRRRSAAQYRDEHLVELYMAFSIRSSKVETRNEVSDEFSRMDFIDNASSVEFQEQFYDALGILADLDISFSKYEEEESSNTKLSKGKNIFDSQPARIGFMVAMGTRLLGRQGELRDYPREPEISFHNLKRDADDFVCRLREMDNEELGEFLSLDVLRESLDRRVGQVGRWERELYNGAFSMLVERDFKVPTMAICWRAVFH